MAHNVHRSAAGVRIQGGGHAVVAGDAQASIHRVQLIHCPGGVGAVKDVAVDGMTAGGVELGQGVGGAADAWGNGDIPRSQWAHFAGIAERIGTCIQIQSRQVDGGCAAQQQPAVE